MGIEDDIVDWARRRPPWQRAVLRRVARGDHVDAEDYREIVDRLCTEEWKSAESFEVCDFPSGAPSAGRVRIVAIKDAKNVNALVEGQQLRFAPHGMTLVFGENASGKSGYARLIKAVVRARHREDVLTDIFSHSDSSTASAVITLQCDDETFDVHWPQAECADLNRVSFYDEACGDAYVTKEAETTYRPFALFVMDGLIRACDGLREELDRRISENQARATPRPMLEEGTGAAKFLAGLSAQTTPNDVEAACRLPADVEDEIERLKDEEARLAATDPAKEKDRLQRAATRLDALARHASDLAETLGDDATPRLRNTYAALRKARDVAKLASERSFEMEPVGGIGTASWRSLWDAARRFATEHSLDFPPTSPEARCVLCHQELDDEATMRLQRFEAFVRDEAQRDLDAASKAWTSAVQRIEEFDCEPSHVMSAVEALEDEHADLIAPVRSMIEAYCERRVQFLTPSYEDPWSVPTTPAPSVKTSELSEQAEKLRAKANGLDEESFATDRERVVSSRQDLEATRELAKRRTALVVEVERLRELEELERLKAQTDTRGISRKAAEITREHVTEVMRDRFTHEAESLRLDRVALADAGGLKGTLRHQPAFVGAIQEVPLPRVLSEGEQNALGLAGFFTETHFDSTQSAIVLDDPVSSLDHVRRGRTARRLVQFAKERQVIVFTHDISFAIDLTSAARDEGVAITERAVERRGAGQPGVCIDKHPWKARDARQRLGDLRAGLAQIREARDTWDQETYEREACEWAGRLSETWERIITLEVVGQVVDRGTQEVRPRKFRLLSSITEKDDRDFQASYGRCSRWARRHDKSVEYNYVAPTADEMQHELDFVAAWFDRVRKYVN